MIEETVTEYKKKIKEYELLTELIEFKKLWCNEDPLRCANCVFNNFHDGSCNIRDFLSILE